MSKVKFSDWMSGIQEHTETALARFLPPACGTPSRLHGAIRYATLGGGKRVRPLLAFAAGQLTDAPCERIEVVACAVEMIHAYSLVHDDLPCMDNDVLRRGRPTCHIEYDEPTALLVGDSLQSLAFELMAQNAIAETPTRQIEMISLLAHASGSHGMAGGQAIDLSSVGKALNQPELELMHALKTGALIRAATLLGALCGREMDKEQYDALDRFSKRAGLLFQVIDDILDCTTNTATLGKTTGKDEAANKPTYVKLLSLQGAKDYAEELRCNALSSLSPFGEKAHRLTELADFICHRNF